MCLAVAGSQICPFKWKKETFQMNLIGLKSKMAGAKSAIYKYHWGVKMGFSKKQHQFNLPISSLAP